MADPPNTTAATGTPPPASTGVAGGANPFASGLLGSGLHLAHTVRAMKVYGITDDNLGHLEDNQASASRNWAIFWFLLGVAANVFTNLIFQEKLSPMSQGAMSVTVLVCFFGVLYSFRQATADDRRRASLIQNIRDQSIYLDPANEQIMKLLDQIKAVTTGKSGTNT